MKNNSDECMPTSVDTAEDETRRVLAAWEVEARRERDLACCRAIPIIQRLGSVGIGTITAEYNGAGDAGAIESISTVPETELSAEDFDVLENFIVSYLPGGWEIENGSKGSVTLDLTIATMSVDHEWLEYVAEATKTYCIALGTEGEREEDMAEYLDHARSSALRFGGVAADYIRVHKWLDRYKSHFSDFRHRAMTHHGAGIWEAVEKFGDSLSVTGGKEVSVKAVCEQHVIEDLGRIPTVAEWLQLIRPESWMWPRPPKADEGDVRAEKGGGIE